MRISELSRDSGIPIPTIKFYLREGLLHAGVATSANQASYDTGHLQRLRLIRAMIDIAGLPVATAREVLSAVDSDDVPLARVFGAAQSAVSRTDAAGAASAGPGAERARRVIADRDWTMHDGNPGIGRVATVVDAFDALGHPELVDLVDDYSVAAEIVARADLRAVGTQHDVSAMAETVVAGTVLGDSLFAGLRRMAQEHVTHELFPHVVEPAASDRRTHEEASAR